MAKVEKRTFQRKEVIALTCIVPIGNSKKETVKCITCDISEGGIRIETENELEFPKYNIIMANQKFPVKVIFKKKLENNNILHGMMFTKPVSQHLVKEIINNLNKSNEGTSAIENQDQ